MSPTPLPVQLALCAVLLVPALTSLGLLVASVPGATSWGPPRPKVSRALAVLAMTLSSLCAVLAVWLRPVVDLPWLPGLDVRLHLGVDGISAPLLLLAAGVGLIAVALPSESARAGYHGLLLATAAATLLALLSRDAVVFVVALELALLPMWWLIHRYGDDDPLADRRGAARRFLLVSAVGSTLTLAGALAVVVAAGTADLDALATAGGLGGPAQTGAALVLLLGLAVQVPVWPLHTWLPWAHAAAPTAGSVLLAAVLLTLGSYGMVRLVAGPLPDGLATLAPVLGALGVVGVLWAGLAALVEPDLKRLIAWSSIAQLGVVTLALSTGSYAGVQAALLGAVAHGLVAALLLVVVGALKDRWGSTDLSRPRAAVRESAPRLGWGLVVGVAAGAGVPGLALFWAEISTLLAAWDPAPDRTDGWFRVFAGFAALGVVLAVAYGVRVLREVWAGDRLEPRIADAGRVEVVAIAVLGAALVVLGVLPSLVLDLTGPDVARMLGVGP